MSPLGFIVVLALLAGAHAAANTTVWKSNVVLNSSLILDDTELTIQSGVTVTLGPNVTIFVPSSGAIHARGTATRPIVFQQRNDTPSPFVFFFGNQSKLSSDFKYVQFSGSNVFVQVDTPTASVSFDHCLFSSVNNSYGPAAACVFNPSAAPLSFTYSQFTNCHYGIYGVGAAVRNCNFTYSGTSQSGTGIFLPGAALLKGVASGITLNKFQNLLTAITLEPAGADVKLGVKNSFDTSQIAVYVYPTYAPVGGKLDFSMQYWGSNRTTSVAISNAILDVFDVPQSWQAVSFQPFYTDAKITKLSSDTSYPYQLPQFSTLSGPLGKNMTLSSNYSVYTIQKSASGGDFVVLSGVTLTIPAGVTIELNSSDSNTTSMYVFGSVVAQGGNGTQPVVFRAPSSCAYTTPPVWWNYTSNETSPPVWWNYTSPPPVWWNETSPPVWWNYTSPPPVWWNYTSPPPVWWNYTSPPPVWWNYTSPPPIWWNETSPPPVWWNYTSPPPVWWNYTSPPPAWWNYTSPPPNWWNYTSPPPVWWNETSPPVWWNYTSPPPNWWNYTSPPPVWWNATTAPTWWNATTAPTWWNATTAAGWWNQTSPPWWWNYTTPPAQIGNCSCGGPAGVQRGATESSSNGGLSTIAAIFIGVAIGVVLTAVAAAVLILALFRKRQTAHQPYLEMPQSN